MRRAEVRRPVARDPAFDEDLFCTGIIENGTSLVQMLQTALDILLIKTSFASNGPKAGSAAATKANMVICKKIKEHIPV